MIIKIKRGCGGSCCKSRVTEEFQREGRCGSDVKGQAGGHNDTVVTLEQQLSQFNLYPNTSIT